MDDSIMITGLGAVIGQGIARSLLDEKMGFRLVGIDENEFSAGFQWTDVSYSVPKTDDPSWISFVTEICNKEKVLFIIPGIEQDIKALLNNRYELVKSTKAVPFLNSSEALRVGFDKWKLYCFAKHLNILMPLTWLVNDVSISSISDELFPLLLKPRKGMASKGIHKVENKNDLEYWFKRINVTDYMLQQYIGSDDEEYTVSIFGFKDGTLSEPFALRRKLNYGSTFEAETVYDRSLSKEVSRIAKVLNIVGPTNLQYRRVGNDFFLFEINPRFTSSTSIKSAFGFNEPLMAIKSFVLGQSHKISKFKKGRCSRYLADSIIFK